MKDHTGKDLWIERQVTFQNDLSKWLPALNLCQDSQGNGCLALSNLCSQGHGCPICPGLGGQSCFCKETGTQSSSPQSSWWPGFSTPLQGLLHLVTGLLPYFLLTKTPSWALGTVPLFYSYIWLSTGYCAGTHPLLSHRFLIITLWLKQLFPLDR